MNLEVKYYCTDFESIRDVLRSIGAESEGVKDQVDYYFNLPGQNSFARMKYREEVGTRTLVYYTRPDFFDGGSAPCDFQLFDDPTGSLLPILKNALGVSSVVKKKREQWRKGPAMFHLDDVEGVGTLFEIEHETEEPEKVEREFQELLAQFMPFLGEVAPKSNGDEVTASFDNSSCA